MRNALFAVCLILAACAPAPVAEVKREPPKEPPKPVVAQHVKDGVYSAEGPTVNSGFIVGETGVVVFDAQRSVEGARQVIAEIAKVTSKPIVAIVVSHGDPDHVAGLPAFPAGVPIIAHENTKAQLVIAGHDPKAPAMWAPVYKGLLKFLPTRTIAVTESLTLGGVRMVLMYVAPAHSSGDLILYLPDQKIVFAGDVLTTNYGPFPIIHYETGGSSPGWIATVKAMLALDAETYVAGHGPVVSKDTLRTQLREVEQRRAQIKAMVEQGKSVAEIKQALPEPKASPRFPTFAETTYDELVKGHPPARAPWENILPEPPKNPEPAKK